MPTAKDFEHLLRDIEREAEAEGPEAVRELRNLQAKYRREGAAIS